MPWSTCPFGPLATQSPVSDFFHELVVWCAWSHREADTRPEAGRFSRKPGVTPLVDDNLSVRGLGHSE